MDFGKKVFRKGQRFLIVLFSSVLMSMSLSAQVPVAIATGGLPVSARSIQLVDEPEYPHAAIGLLAGVGALPGIELTLKPASYINVRLGYHHFNLNFNDLEIDPTSFGYVEGPKLKVNGAIHLSTINIAVDFMPLHGDWLRLAAGVGLGLNNSISGRFELVDPLKVNDLELSPEEVGYVEGTYFTELPFYPYLGLGFGRVVPKRRFAISGDLGTFYRPAPQFELNSTELIEDNDTNDAVLEENFMKWRWQPTINLRLSYRLK